MAQLNGEDVDGIPEEAKQWEDLLYKPFQTETKQFAICLDTLGQNREFTEEEKFFVVKTVRNFQEQWAKRESINLAFDIELKIHSTPFDTQYKKKVIKEDDKEIEQIGEESIIAENAIKHEQDEDELNKEQIASLRKRVIFHEFTKGFWAPDSVLEY